MPTTVFANIYYLHFTEEETEAEKCKGTFPKLQNGDLNAGPSGSNAGSLSARPYGLHETPCDLHCTTSFK